MGRRVLILTVCVAFVCVAQGLKCNHCKSINKAHPTCEEIEERECTMGLNYCIKFTLHEPAYGEVRRCASRSECEAEEHPLVDRECCAEDLCN
ncbi:hypothetical protein AOLI_G00132210 [Acnodon oligacanthus]